METKKDAEKHVVVGTAGHIDHGKSALVEVLTGTNPDRLEEEKRRGITIDLGFAFLKLEEVQLGFVDVPGHERFVRNMLAGVGGIDLVLLVIAADESIKPQTREHFDICRLLAIPRGLIAITKADLVDPDMPGLVRLEIEEFARESFLEGAPIVPVSAKTGFGLDLLKRELLAMARAVPEKDASRPFRLPIDRSFAMKGFGTVVTGTLISGSLKIEDEAEIYPMRRRVRIRGLHSGGAAIEHAVAGQRTAVNLAGIDHREIQRGMVLSVPGIFNATRRFDARITLLGSARPLKNHARVHFHQGASEMIAEVALLERDTLRPGETTLAQLRLESETLLLPGDRFILRQFSPVVTIGGGAVIDPGARRYRRGDAFLAPFLETLERGSREEVLTALSKRLPQPLLMNEIIGRTGWTEAQIRATTRQLAAEKQIRILIEEPLKVAAFEWVESCSAAIHKSVEDYHRANPLVPGIQKQDLRGRMGEPDADVFRTALDDAVKKGTITVSGDLVQRAGRQIALTQEELRAKEIIEREFERAGLTVPSFSAVLQKVGIEAGRAQKILQMLLRERILIKVAEDLVFHRKALERLRALLGDYKEQKGSRLAVPEFKELTGVTRKYAIPLLEYLDRQHVTRRVGDGRVIL
jgi:selenocysteine-specific elongation factor